MNFTWQTFHLKTFAPHLVLLATGQLNLNVFFTWPRLWGGSRLSSCKGCKQPLAMQNLQHLLKLLQLTRPLFFCPSKVRGAALVLMSACSLPCTLEAALPKAPPCKKKEPPAEFTKAGGWKVQCWNFFHFNKFTLNYIHLTLLMGADAMLVWFTLYNLFSLDLHSLDQPSGQQKHMYSSFTW